MERAEPTSPAPDRRTPTEAVGAGLPAVAWVAALFGSAGTVRWQAGWVYLAVVVVGLGAHRAFVAARNPALLERRARIGAGTKAWDKAWLSVFWALMLAAPLVAGIDTIRLGHRPLAAWLVVAGAVLFASGMTLSGLAMAANPFFEGTARVQPDQRVVDVGPYRRVRHPGYAGLLLWALSSPLLLRSGWASVPALLAAAWVVVRTALEDRMLRHELAGYDAYARRVRRRFVPGGW